MRLINACIATVSQRIIEEYNYTNLFIWFWQPRKAGLKKHIGESCVHKIHKNTLWWQNSMWTQREHYEVINVKNLTV